MQVYSIQSILENTISESICAYWQIARQSVIMVLYFEKQNNSSLTDKTKKEMDQMEKMVQQPLLQKAIVFAAMKHEGYVRKGTTIPYFTHVMEAMEIVSRMTEDEEVRAAAVLHDTMEDTPTTNAELEHFFGKRVADLVAAESENKRRDQPEAATWLERKLETIQHLEKAKTEIRMIALGDKLSNVRAMYRDYQKDGDKLWEKFNNPDPKAQGKYYCSLANAFWDDEDIHKTPAFREYSDLCAEIFHVERDQNGKFVV